MVWYCQRVLTDGVQHALLPMVLGGIAFGLGCAAKWTGIYAGAGLAVLYLGVLWARRQQGRPGFWAEFRLAALGGVLFYVVLPLCIYVASYLPYWWRQPDFSLGDWWRCQLSMYSYHATLKATHPFESRWYTWLLGLRPIWYYRNGGLPYGMKASIAGLASGQRARQPSGRSGADPVRHAAYPMDACHALHLFVPLFPQLDVLSGGAGPYAGPYAPPGLGAPAVRRPLRRGGCAVCRLLSGSIRSAHPRMVGRCIGSAAELWVLLKKKPPLSKGGAERSEAEGFLRLAPRGTERGAQPMNGKHNKKLTPCCQKASQEHDERRTPSLV